MPRVCVGKKMTRKIKSANKVETGARGCFFALCVCVFFLLFSVSQSPMFPGGSWFSFDEKVNNVSANSFPTLYATTGASVLPQSYMT